MFLRVIARNYTPFFLLCISSLLMPNYAQILDCLVRRQGILRLDTGTEVAVALLLWKGKYENALDLNMPLYSNLSLKDCSMWNLWYVDLLCPFSTNLQVI